MPLKSTLATVAAVFCAVGSQALRAECVVPPWQPVVVKGAICGIAMDVGRFPFEDVELELRDDERRIVATVHTDVKGSFRFPPVAEGTYQFYVRGFFVPHGAVTVRGAQSHCGKPVTVTFEVGIENCDGTVLFEGVLEVATNLDDDDIQISIDGNPYIYVQVERNTERIWLTEGVHDVLVEARAGYRPVKRRIRIRAGETTTYKATLPRSTRRRGE